MLKGFIGGALADRLLARYIHIEGVERPTVYDNRSKLEVLFGPDIWTEFKGKTVIDFGCEHGKECIEIAQHGSQLVVGLEVREDVLARTRERVRAMGLGQRRPR
jgi:SAM-dependent methyltransferase